MPICAAPFLAQGAKGAEQAGTPVLSVLALDPIEGIPQLETLAVEAVPIRTLLPRQLSDTVTILSTSGTTGKSKEGGLPLFDTSGQTCTLNTGLRAGAKIVLLPKFDGDTALRPLIESGCTIMMGVPTLYIALLEAAKKTTERPKLPYAISGGSSLPVPVAVIERLRAEFGAEIYEGSGLTETSPVASFNNWGRTPRSGSIGTPTWGVDV